MYKRQPKYTVFFKAKDADALTSAFEEFTNRKLKTKEKPKMCIRDRSIGDFALTAQQVGHDDGGLAQRLAGGVNDVPLALDAVSYTHLDHIGTVTL